MLFCITDYCSMGCPHCMSDCTTDGKHASGKIIYEFIDFAKRMNTTKIAISGGEPTEHPEFLTHFNSILKTFSGRSSIALLSNGQWLSDPYYVKELSNLQNKYIFSIQISAIKNIYPHRETTIENFIKNKKQFSYIYLVEEIICFEYNLGRAKGKSFSINSTYERSVPSCFNFFINAKSGVLNSLKSLILLVDTKSNSSTCKPMIQPDGSIYPGENKQCVSIGNIVTDTEDIIFDNLRTRIPCETCGTKVPDIYRSRIGLL